MAEQLAGLVQGALGTASAAVGGASAPNAPPASNPTAPPPATTASTLPSIRELATAVAHGDLAKVEYLLLSGANPNTPGPDGLTPLGAAAASGNTPLIRLLLKFGADYAQRMANEKGWAPLHLAAYAGHLGAVDALLSAGANTNQPAGPAAPPVIPAPAVGVAAGAPPPPPPSGIAAAATTALNLAAYTGHADIIKRLLAGGADANAPSAGGVTPLQFASIYGKVEAVSALLKGGAKESINQPAVPATAAAAAAAGTFPPPPPPSAGTSTTSPPTLPLPPPEAVPDAKPPRGYRTALFYAAQYGHPEIVKVLLDNGAQPGIADKKELTPLHIASKYGRLECVRQLLPVSDPSRVSKKGYTPQGLAERKGWGDVVGLFGSSSGRH